MNRVGEIATAKLHYFKCNDCLSGYLTPAEAIWLIDNDYQLVESNRYLETFLRQAIKEGKSSGRWLYFEKKKGTMYYEGR